MQIAQNVELEMNSSLWKGVVVVVDGGGGGGCWWWWWC